MNRIYLLAIVSTLAACTPTKEASEFNPVVFETFKLNSGQQGGSLCAPDSECPSVIDHCTFKDADSIFIAEVVSSVQRLSCVSAEVPRQHHLVTVVNKRHVAGSQLPATLEFHAIDYPDTDRPKAGDQLLVAARNVKGSRFAHYIFAEETADEVQAHDHAWIDLPSTMTELASILGQTLQSPEAVCSQERLARLSTRQEIDAYETQEPNPSYPCGEPIVVDDDDVNADPGPSPEDDI